LYHCISTNKILYNNLILFAMLHRDLENNRISKINSAALNVRAEQVWVYFSTHTVVFTLKEWLVNKTSWLTYYNKPLTWLSGRFIMNSSKIWYLISHWIKFQFLCNLTVSYRVHDSLPWDCHETPFSNLLIKSFKCNFVDICGISVKQVIMVTNAE
jgi:hypothetical protein